MKGREGIGRQSSAVAESLENIEDSGDMSDWGFRDVTVTVAGLSCSGA
jgi:hypothetical protein